MMGPFSLLRWLWEDWKAYRRGERRIAPRGSRGRIYEKKSGGTSQPGHRHMRGGVKEIEVTARKIHADGTVEDLGVVSRGKAKPSPDPDKRG